MKRMMKRGLSLLLAVLMVASMLPTSVWAVTFADGEDSGGREETPILDKNDPVVRPNSNGSGLSYADLYKDPEASENPEEPDPSEGPGPGADLSWTNQSVSATINPDGSWTATLRTDSAALNEPSNTWGVVLVPTSASNKALVEASVNALVPGDNVASHTGLRTSISTDTGIDPKYIVAVGSSGEALRADASGAFVVNSTTATQMPDMDTLAEMGLTAPVEVVVVFFAKGSTGNGTHIKMTTATYGEVEMATGIPSLVYTLNKSGGGTLTLDSATLAGEPWTAPASSGSWSVTTLTVPVYNRTGDGVTLNTGTISMPSGVTGSGLTNETIDNDAQADISFDVPTDVKSCIITVPISGVTVNGGDPVSATITVKIISSGYTADPIEWVVTKGYKVAEMGDAAKKTIKIHKPASADNATQTVLALVNTTNNSATAFTAAIPDGSKVKLNTDNVKVSRVANFQNGYAAAFVEPGTYGGGSTGNTVAQQVIVPENSELRLELEDGLEVGTYTFMVELSGLAIARVLTTTKAGGRLALADTISVPVTIVVNPPEEEPEEYNYKYTLTYDANATGVTAPDAETFSTTSTATSLDHEFTVTSTKPTRSGYKFLGWADSSSATAADYAGGDKITLTATSTSPTASKIIYAVWLEQTTITYNVNYPTAASRPGTDASLAPSTGPSANTGDKGRTIDTTANTLKLADTAQYTFGGWYTEATCTNAAGSAYAANANATLYAKWTAIEHQVTYSDGGVTGVTGLPATNPVTGILHGTDHTISTTEPTRAGYTFAGWTSDVSGDSTVYKTGTANNAITVNADITLTAQWTADPTSAIFYLNGGDKWKDNATDASITVSGAAGTAASLAAAKMDPVRDHYTFGGWSSSSGDSNAGDKVASTVFPAIGAAANEYYAIWTPDTYTVTYSWGAHQPVSGGNNVAVPAGTTLTYAAGGASYTVATTPALNSTHVDSDGKGWVFTGWTLTGGGAGVAGTPDPGENLTGITANVTLTAKWTEKMYTVTYDWGTISGGTPIKLAGGNETLPTQADVQHGGGFTVASTPNTTTTYVDDNGLGWTLTGWTASGGGQSGNKTPGASVTNVTGNVTLTAQWTKKEYTVTFNKNTGTFDDGTTANTKVVTVQHGTAAGAAPDVSKTDYSLIDWNTNASGGGTVYSPTALVTANATYYARWLGDTNNIVVKVTLDTQPYKGQSVSLKGQSYSATENPDGTYTFSDLPVGTYTVVVNTREVQTVTISKTTAGDVAAKFWTVTANVAATGGGYVKAGASASPTVGTLTTDSVIVYNGETAYVNASPATDYKFSTWSNTVSGTATTAANSVANVTNTTTATATFVKKTGSIVVNAKKDTATTAHTFPNGTVVTLVPTGATKGADTSKERTQTVSNATTGAVTFSNLEHDSANGWDIYVGDTKIAAGSNVKVTGADNSSTSVNAMYYTVEVKTGGNGDASMTANGSTQTTDYTAGSTGTTKSAVVLEQSQVTWTVGTPATDYDFLNWDGNQTNKTAYQNVSITAKTTHTANFSKVSFTVQAVVNLDEVAQTALGASITAIKAVKTAGSKDDPANLDFTYNSTAGKWVLSGLPTGNTYKVVVTTSTGDFDIATGITADKNDVVGHFFTVKTATKSDYESTQAVMAVTSPSATGKTEVVVKSGTSITLTVSPASGYTHTGWTEANTTNKVSSNAFAPTDVTTAGTGITLTPTFTYTATIKPTRGGNIYDVDTVVVKTGNTTVGTATEQTDKTWKVSGLTIGTNYDIWVNGYLSDKDTNGVNEVEVPIWKLTTADDPVNSASTKTVKGVTSIDMPNGAGEANMALSAAAATGYRLRTATETPATWTSSDTIAAVAANMNTVTVTNITKDVTLTVNAVKQWTVDVKNTNKSGGTLGNPVVSSGTAVAVNATSGNSVGNKVDTNATITVSVTPNPGYTPKWTVTKPDGTAIADKTVSGNGNAVTVDQDMTITVDWELTAYTVEVKVNLDNTAKGGLTGAQLYLVKGSDTIALTETATAGTYTAKVVPGTYTIWSPVASANGATAQTTGRTIDFAVADGEKSLNSSYASGDASKLKAELNYYTVKIAKEFSDSPATAPTNVFAGHGATAPANATAETAAASKIYLAGKGAATVNVPVAATQTSSGEPNYVWSQWKSGSFGGIVPNAAAGGVYVLPGENALKANGLGDDGVTVTAVFQRRYKVTLGNPVRVGGSTISGNYASAELAGAQKVSTNASNNSALVNVGATGAAQLGVDKLALGSNSTEYIFAYWTQDQTGDNAGTFADGGNTKTGKDTFTPKTNTTITPNYWLKPTLTANVDKYHQNFKTEENVDKTPWNNTKNFLPKYTWTANDATYVKTTITVDGTEKDLTATEASIVTDSTTGNVTITFERDYLLALLGSQTGEAYTIKVYSHTPDATEANGEATDKTATMKLYVTPESLTKVVIGVKDGTAANYETDPATAAVAGSATAKVNDGTRGGVKYLDHANTKIVPSNLLTYDWYYGPNPSTAYGGTDASPATKAAAEAQRPNGFTLITAGDTTGAVPVDNANYKGKYIYAVVEASNTGKGAVLTNAIAVDYDAVVKVKQDTALVAAANKGDYSVYLVPHKNDNQAVYASTALPAGSVQAKAANATGDGLYKTDDSALTGGVTYDVYANRVQGDHTTYVKVTGLSVSTQTAEAAAPEVNFYSVNAVTTALKHAQDNAGTDVGETFASTPGTGFTAKNAANTDITVASGKGVLSGTAVTAAASSTWTQDYWWNWQSNNNGTFTSYGTEHQASGAANKGYTISAKTYIGGQLEQKTYAITGDIKGTGKVDSATLSASGHTFDGNVGNGQNGATVSFTVPRSSVTAGAITDDYTITATASTNPRTTVQGYSVPSKAAQDQREPMELAQVTAAGNDKFTIFIGASVWKMKVVDDNAPTAASVEREITTPASAAPNPGTATTTWTKVFDNYTGQLDYNVTVTNEANTGLNVALKIKKTLADGSSSYIYDSTTTGTSVTDTNGVKIEDLVNSFSLTGKATAAATPDAKIFKLTIPTTLENADDVTYSFEFTSKDSADATLFGPSLTYNLALTVNPIPVKTLAITKVTDYSYTVDTAKPDITFDATNTSKLNATGATASNVGTDVEYSWYAIPHGATASINATTGVITVSSGSAVAVTNAALLSDNNRTIDLTGNYDYAGKDLVAVAHGVKNATNYAISSDSFSAPRQLVIDLYHNATKQTGATAPAGHTVYVVPKDGSFDTATAIQATWDGTKNGYTAAVTTGADYDIYANIVGGTATDNKHFQKITTVASTATANPQVIYHSVTINDTTVDNTYTGLVGTDYFTAAPTGKPAATVPDKAATPGTIDVTSGGWVVKGNNVTFTYPAWNKDYSLAWSGSVSATDANTTSNTDAVHSLNNLSAAATVDTQLQLKLYTVTAYVVGAGTANYVTMTADTDANRNVFTTKTGNPSGSILGIASSRNSIDATEGGTRVEFSVPKGTYVAVGDTTGVSGTTREGYHITHGDSTLITAGSITKTIAAADTFDVVLTSTGVGLSVTDDDTGTTPHSVQGMYVDTPVAAHTEPAHTETLEYGYTGTKDIVLTLKNASAYAAGHKQLVYNVAGTGGDATGSPVSGVIWTSTDLSVDGTTTTIDTLDEDGGPTVTLTIPNGLKAGTYTYNAVFTFAAAADGATVGTLTYNLEIVVNPAQFATVDMKYDGASAAIDTTKPLEAGKDLALNTATTTVNPVFASLTGGTDYHYAWYASTDNTIKTADLNWNTNTGAVTFTGGKSATSLNKVDQNLDAATIAGHQSEYIYLMIYATANNGKVIKAAISAPVRAGYQGVVQIKENAVLQTAEPKTGGAAKYTVKIVDGTTELDTKWDDDAKGYVAVDGSDPIYLDPAKTYTVKVSAYEGDTTTTALTGATIKGDNLAANSHIATAEYFTVTAVATTAVHYVDAVGETFDNDNMPKAKLSVDGADVDGKTVLKGQDVAAKFDAVDAGKAWTQDYTLTWQEKKDNSADGTSLDNTSLTDNATSAVTTGQTWKNIQTKTYIGGRLDQNTYIISGTIVGDGSVASVVMTDDKGKANTTVKDGTINKDNNNKITDVDNNGTVGDKNDTITLKVVKGTYALKANAGPNTTVVGIKWADDAREPGDSVAGKDVSADRAFLVYLSAATAKLQVADTHTTPAAHTATSDAGNGNDNDNFKHADHKHEVFFSAMTADETLTVNLKNKGNTDLTLDTPTVWKVNAGSTLANVKWDNWANANPVTKIDTDTDGVYTKTDVIDIENLLTDANKTLTGATTDATGTQQNDGGDVDAATVTVSQNVDVADSGIYILRYTTGSGGPVVYYVLDLVVKPLPIVNVTTEPLTEAPGAGDKVRMEGYDATGASDTSFAHVFVNDGTNSVAASTVAAPVLTDGTDVKYQWVKSTSNLTATQAKGHLSVGASGVTGDATVTVLSGNGADSKEYTLQSADEDAYLYLVAYAPVTDPVVNTSSFAVSAPVKTKETVKIFVDLNGQRQNLTNASDPQYEIKLLPPGGDPATDLIATTWNTGAVANNNNSKYYTAAIDTTKTYKIYAVSYKGTGAPLVDTGLTLGAQASGDPVKEKTVPYWDVTFNENVPVVNASGNGLKSYLPGGAATSTNALQKAMSVAVSDAKGGTATYDDGVTLPSGTTPVLEGMNVKVAVDGAKPNGNGDNAKAWTEYSDFHTMSIPSKGWSTTGNKTSGIAYAANISSGDIQVTGAKTFDAQLDQILFSAKFRVVDVSEPHNTTTRITEATLTCRETGVSGRPPIVVSVPNGAGQDGYIVTFTNVPAGDYTIAAEADGDQTSSMVVGYTWNTGLTGPQDPGDMVTVTKNATTNEETNDTDGNTIQIQLASNLVQWKHNFDNTSGGIQSDFVNSTGFQRVDSGDLTKADLSLPVGYDETTHTLTYTVRVQNTGTTDLENFRIGTNLPSGQQLEYDLATAKVYAEDGTEIGPYTPGISLLKKQYVEFEVKILEGKDAQAAVYDGTTFTAICEGGLPENRDKYQPAYQVKAKVTADDVTAAIFYGDDDFDGAAPKVEAKDGFTGQNFAYDVLTEAELTAYLADQGITDRPDNVYTKDGVTTGGTAVNKQPDWLELDATTGQFSVAAAAKGVHVRKDDAGQNVTDELVVYVKITSTDDLRLNRIVPVTIDVKTSPLKIITANITDENQKTLDGGDYVTQYGTNIPHDADVLLEHFAYHQVENEKNTVDVVDDNLTSGGHTYNAAGETTDRTDTAYGVVTMGHWKVVPVKFNGNGDNKFVAGGDVTNTHSYEFTYVYDGSGPDAEDRFDYADAVITLDIPVLVPDNYKLNYANGAAPLPQITGLPTAAEEYAPDDTVTVKGFDVAKDDEKVGSDGLYYTFQGWSRSDTSDVYNAGGTFNMPTTDVVLTASWTPVELSVTYKYNDGGATADKAIPNAVQKGGDYTVDEADPARTGYTFLGWTVTGGTPSASPLKNGGSVNKVTGNVVLSAQWGRDQSTIVYDWNYEGSSNETHNGPTDTTDANVPTTAPARTGWTWDGKWYAEADAQTQVTAFKFPAAKNGTVTYYANWTRDESKIVFDLNGGNIDGATADIEKTGYTGETLPGADFPANPVRSGFTFAGWSGGYTGANLPKFPAAKDGVLTITAQWTRDASTVTFVLDGGNIDGETDDIVKAGPTGTTMAEVDFPEDPVRRGYAFEYWLGEDAEIYSVDDLPRYPADKGGNLTITAQWRPLVQGLKFSDVRSNAAAVNDSAATITLTDPDHVLTDMSAATPEARGVKRAGEYVIYLDAAPIYTVSLRSDGDPVYNVSVTATDARGVTYTDLPVNVATFAGTDGAKTVTLNLAALRETLWVGDHHILLTATGNTEPDGTGAVVSATYELTINIQPRPIPVSKVETGPTKVTDKDGKDLRTKDPNGDTPVIAVAITPGTPGKPNEKYDSKIVINAGVNYVFVPDTGDYTVKTDDPYDTEPETSKVTFTLHHQDPVLTIGAHLVTAAGDAAVTTNFSPLIGKEMRDYRAQSDDTVKYPRAGTTYGTDWWWSMGDTPATVLNVQPGTDAEGKAVAAPKFEFNKTYVLTVKLDPNEADYKFAAFGNMKATFDKDNAALARDLTRQANAAQLLGSTEGFTILTDENGNYYLRAWYRVTQSIGGGGGGGGTPACPNQVSYLLGLYGTTKDPVMELVSGKNVKAVPNVSAIVGYKFLGWSLAGPIGDDDKDAVRTLVDPKEVTIEGDTVFYAVYQPLYNHGRPFHEHYVIGYPNGNFGPNDDINRASVATIIARAVLPNFVEGADYGNPGGYSDVDGHWAASAIAYCTRYGVFKGYEDGTFRPDQPISRQELVLTLARLSGEQKGTAPFSDMNQAGDWAKGGIYTAYVKGWVNGYTDGTFRPTNSIARDETVKIFNAYLNRGVNAEGLASLKEYVHSGVASNNTENGTSEYMTWPDVTRDQWAYYEIIEAANDHEYVPDATKKAGYTLPEVWTKCWIDEKWRYNDDPNDGGPAAVTMALLRKHGVIA